MNLHERMFTILASLVLALLFLNQVEAQRILIVSDSDVPGGPGANHEDDALPGFLASLGYDVDVSGMNQAMRGDWSADPAINAAVDAADLIIVTRRTSSGSYNNPPLWNGIEKPLLLASGFLSRDNRWGWFTDSNIDGPDPTTQDMEIVDTTHPFVQGLGAGPVPVFDWDDAGSTANPDGNQAPKAVQVGQVDTIEPGGNVVGTFGGRAFLFEFPSGTDLGDKGVLGGPRAFLGHWGYDDDRADFGIGDYLTDAYLLTTSNVVATMAIPEPSSVSLLGLGLLGFCLRRRRR